MRHHRDITETRARHRQNNTETSPKKDRDKTKTRPRHDRDMTETSQRHHRDKTETTPKQHRDITKKKTETKTRPRHDRDITQTPPKQHRDITETRQRQEQDKNEIRPRHDRDKTETSPRQGSIIRQHTGHSYTGLPKSAQYTNSNSNLSAAMAVLWMALHKEKFPLLADTLQSAAGIAGKQRWALILPSSARVSQVTYTTVIGVRYPELDNCNDGLTCFGNYLLGKQSTHGGFLPVFWDAPTSYMHGVVLLVFWWCFGDFSVMCW